MASMDSLSMENQKAIELLITRVLADQNYDSIPNFPLLIYTIDSFPPMRACLFDMNELLIDSENI